MVTVTATASGANSFNGIALTVKVLTGAVTAGLQFGVTASGDVINPPQIGLTPGTNGSVVYGAVVNVVNTTPFTPNAATTFSQNDVDLSNGAVYGTFRSTATTIGGTPVTVGASAPAIGGDIAVAEILAAHPLVEDVTSPPGVTTAGAKTITTASFTPPIGSLMVAMVAANHTSGAITMAVADSQGFTWIRLASDPNQLATVWVAQVTFQAAVVSTWSGSYGRAPLLAVSPPAWTPLAIPVANTAGHWLFAVASWRQDAGIAGQLTYPSSVSISDDVGNFWIPVKVSQSSGIVRTSVWMAPAARAASFVFASPCPTGDTAPYQPSLAVLIMEVTASCPWYSIAATASQFTNQGTSITLSETPPAGLFTIGTVTTDNNSVSGSVTSTGWTGPITVVASNHIIGVNDTGDLFQQVFYATTPGTTMTISGTTVSAVDWAEVLITVHGVTDVLPFPYATPIENWPAIVCEIASGPVANADPVFANGMASWVVAQGTAVAVTWPQYNPWPSYQTVLSGSLLMTPSGTQTQMNIESETQPVSVSVQYDTLAFVYSPGGSADCYCGINWYTSGLAYISTSGTIIPVPAGGWTQLTLPAPVRPPPTAAFGTVVVTQAALSGNLPVTAILYVGYAAFGPADSYENTPLDELQWIDISSRNFSQDQVSVTRGIQYEQQSLEAGTASVYLANNDGQMMFGNILSSFWPTIGDTDVPFRVRAVNPGSTTPYDQMFTGYTDQIEFGWDSATHYGWAAFECSDAWSRLTAQTLTAPVQEALEDDPVGFWSCNMSGANLALGAQVPVSVLLGQAGTGGAISSFNSTAITQIGTQGASNWQVSGVPFTGVSPAGSEGLALTYFPPSATAALPVVSGGISVDFVFSFGVLFTAEPVQHLSLCIAWAGSGPMWEVFIDNNGGGGQFIKAYTYDKSTGAQTVHNTTVKPVTLATDVGYVAMTFTQTTLTVDVSVAGVLTNVLALTGLNMNATCIGFSWGGPASPLAVSTSTLVGFCNVAIANIGIYAGLLSFDRLSQHYLTGQNAWPSEVDTYRIARVTGYAGYTPVLGMRGLDMMTLAQYGTSTTGPPLVSTGFGSAGAPVLPDLDLSTAISDTSGQVVSSYLTNIAATTLAGMFVNGAGTLIYRRRLEWYDRVAPQWAVGENVVAPLMNTLSQSASTAPWAGFDGATLTSSSATISPVFFPNCALFHGDGSTSGPSIFNGAIGTGPFVTPGNWYSCSAWVYCPQGWPTGMNMFMSYYTSGSVPTGAGGSTAVTPLAAGSLTYLSIPPARADATAAFAGIGLSVSGTPPSSVQFFVANVVFTLVGADVAGGDGSTASEAPYLIDTKLSSDRALLYNYAVLTQFGTQTLTTFSGSDFVFSPTSGISVIEQNAPSIAQRGQVPYTATQYSNNTIQALPYYSDEPSMEDFGNWIVQTLGSPLFRPETVTLTPAATTQALETALRLDVGDTVMYNRRQLSNPLVRILTYCSKLTHSINIGAGTWTTQVELSPFPVGSVLKCDDPIHGTLTGGNYLGW